MVSARTREVQEGDGLVSKATCPSCGEVLPKCQCPSGIIAERANEELARIDARLTKSKAKALRWREKAENLAQTLDGYCSRTCPKFYKPGACQCGGQTAHEALVDHEEDKE